MLPSRTVRAALPAPRFESLSLSLSSQRALLRVSLAAISFAILIAASHQEPAQAGPRAGAPAAPEPLLPQTVGVALESDETITIAFDEPMDPASVEESLLIVPAQRVDLEWDQTRTELTVVPASRWRADERYLVVVDGSAETDGGEAMPASRRFTFTTQSAPEVVEFQVHLAATAKAEDGGADLATARAAVLEADRSAGGTDSALEQPIGKGATRGGARRHRHRGERLELDLDRVQPPHEPRRCRGPFPHQSGRRGSALMER